MPKISSALTPLTAEHWTQVERIHAAGIATGNATFDDQPPTWEQFDAGKHAHLRLVAVDAHDKVLGWSAASPVSQRRVYAGVVEHSIYVDPHVQGTGVGAQLLTGLIEAAEAAGIWTIQSGVFPENTASLALHQAAGFRVVGTRERVGLMTYGPHQGRWRDVVFIERRSPHMGR